jgi:hypothetical protein
MCECGLPVPERPRRYRGLPGKVDDDCLHIRNEAAELLAGGDFIPE